MNRFLTAALVALAFMVGTIGSASATGRPVPPPPPGCHYTDNGHLVCGRPVGGTKPPVNTGKPIAPVGDYQAALLMERYSCETYRSLAISGQVIPTGHVVIRWGIEQFSPVTYSAKPSTIRLALENVRQGKHQWLTVQGFCK